MSLASLSRMFVSESEGWSDLVRIESLPRQLFWTYVVPMSLIPPLMYAFSELVQPGAVFPAVVPHLSVMEAATVGILFFFAELAMVELMVNFIQDRCEAAGSRSTAAGVFTLAAVAPTPLWLSSLALFVPSLWVNVVAVVAAWAGSAVLIRHGVRPLLGVTDGILAHRMGNALIFAGVMAWLGLLMVLELLISFVVGWR